MIDAGIVGLGWWGNRLIESVQGRSERIRFVHGVARDPATKQEIARRHGLVLSPSLDAMLGDRAVQAVVLATPHSLHRAGIEAVAAAGKPVLCEKPLTLTAADAVAAVGAARAAGTLLAVGHNRRFLPALGAMKRLAAAGELGELLHVEGHFSNENSSANFAPWRHDAEESPAGGLTGAGIHLLDAFVALLGPVRSVHAQLVVRKPAPGPLDTLSVLLRFENDVTGTLSTVRATPRSFSRTCSAPRARPSCCRRPRWSSTRPGNRARCVRCSRRSTRCGSSSRPSPMRSRAGRPIRSAMPTWWRPWPPSTRCAARSRAAARRAWKL
jgi:predicted dehydrogenase